MNTTADVPRTGGRAAVIRYGAGLGAVAVALIAAAAFDPLIDPGSEYLLLSTAVLGAAWLGGTGPALAATVVAAIAGAVEVQGTDTEMRATQTHLALFVLQGLVLTAVVSELRRARHLAERQAQDAERARRESEGAARMKDEFLATISHELRTPLNSVLGWLHLLRTGKLDPATAQRGLESIDRNVRLQAQLTGDLLDVSKMLTGQLHLDSRPSSLVDASRQAVSAALPAAQARGVHVTTRLPDGDVTVLGDPTRLRQIVWHLLSNAIKFTPRGGTIGVAIDRTADSATLTVSDSGPGIDPAFLPHIFERFTQEDPSPTRTAGGLGVGLSLVRDLVELHGGAVRAGNRETGGAIFTARFPLHAAAGDAAPAQERPAASLAMSPPLDGLRVLVLDRDAEARELLRTVLEGRGALVKGADSVAEALEELEAWRPDVLVSDTENTQHDSYALIGKVQSLEADRGGRIPAAALTSFGRTDERVRGMLQAFQRQVPKPVEPALLAAEIARLAGRERRRMQRSS